MGLERHELTLKLTKFIGELSLLMGILKGLNGIGPVFQ